MRSFISGFGLSVFVLTFSLTIAEGQTLQQVIEGAKKEGQVRVYSSIGRKSSKPISEAFREKYPFVTKVDIHRMSGLEESERVLAEFKAGRVNMDVQLVRNVVWDRQKAFAVGPVDWKALGVPEDRIKRDGYSTIWAGSGVRGIIYNTKIVPPERAPKSWEDCTDPRWAGKVVVWVRPIFLYQLMPALGESKVIEFARKIAENKPIWDRDQNTATEKVAMGEASLYCGGTQVDWFEAHGKGAPVGFAVPEPVPLSEGRDWFLVKGAKYPNTGKLLMAFMASDEAQLLLEKLERRGDSSVQGTLANKLTQGKKISLFTEEWDLRVTDLSKKIVEVWGLPVAREGRR